MTVCLPERAMNNSCIYEGTVLHRRYQPVEHQFRYPLFMMYVDLLELDNLFDRHWLWSTNSPNLAWFRRSDHHGPTGEPLDQSIRKLVHDRTGTKPVGPIRLLTHFRYFGYVINPISVYYCYGNDGGLEFVVPEVTNTPWGEQHCYVLDIRGKQEPYTPVMKQLHVSPFMQMDVEHRFQLDRPADTLNVSIENFQLGSDIPIFAASMHLHRRPITSASLCRVLLRYPLMTVQVFWRIYWQAFLLWRKKAPIYVHPKKDSTLIGEPDISKVSAASPQPTLSGPSRTNVQRKKLRKSAKDGAAKV
jgi:uncharacterized protein